MTEFSEFQRSKAIHNIPEKKLQEKLTEVAKEEDQKIRNVKLIAINRYAESNIPIEFWSLKMERDFHGDQRLLQLYSDYVADIKKSYMDGNSICLAGKHGTGKSLTLSCILKKCCQKGYTCLYTTLSDIVSVSTTASSEERFLARRELIMVDFLVIDEFDTRFMPSENAADLYARSLENVFRTRSQNVIPTLMATNSPNIIESFTGQMKQSLNSLTKGYLKIFPVLGTDFRVEKDRA
jgi:DNA replication protein DnaC